MDRQIPQVSASSSRPRTIRPAAPVNRVHEARMLNVESRLGVVEAFLSAAPRSSGRRRVIHRSATINGYIHNAIDEANAAGFVFNFDQSLLFKPDIILDDDQTKYNYHVHQKVLDLVTTMFREGAKMAVDQRLDETVIGVINERIRNVFDHQVKACKDNRLPVDVRYAKKESRRRQRMRSAKCAMRQKWFNTAPEHLSTGYGTKEECDALFQLQYMSDEERLVDLESPFSSEYLCVSVPSWRSDEMNNFFHNLDIHRMRSLSSRRAERRFTVVEQEMPITKSDKVVPAWAIRS